MADEQPAAPQGTSAPEPSNEALEEKLASFDLGMRNRRRKVARGWQRGR
jgi:hypothetical protein